MNVRLRDLRPDDQQTVRAVFDGLSPASRYRRFHGPVDRLTPAMLASLAAADGRDHVVLVAEVGRWRRLRPVGLAHLVRTGPVSAEMAFVVVDAAQGRGIGRRLVSATKDRAMVVGYRTLEADVLEDNAPMLAVLHDVFAGVTASLVGEVLELRCPVPSTELELADIVPRAVLAG